jgi:hypothetical protein
MRLLATVLAALASSWGVAGFYIPGTAPVDFQEGDSVSPRAPSQSPFPPHCRRSPST